MRKAFIPVASLAVLLLLTACQTTPPAAGAAASRAPTSALPVLPAAGSVHYAVDAAQSDVRFLVYRAGPLASFGHNHVILAGHIRGGVWLAQDFALSGFELTLPVADFQVDAPEARAVEGPDFAKQPSPQAVAGTLANMLGAQELDAAHFPEVRIRSVQITGPAWGPDLTVQITLHGVERDLTLPVAIEQQDDRLTATGAFTVLQSDFGIHPLSILGGGLQVADAVRIRFRIVARRV